MKTIIKSLLLLLILQLVGCGTYTTVRENPDFAQAKRNIESVAILPADVEITYIVFNGDNERERDKEAATAQALDAMARQILQERNYTVKEADFAAALNENSDMAFDLTQLKTATKTAVDGMYDGKPVTLEKPEYFTKTVGAAANPFSEYAKADALMLINYSGFEKSPGMIAKDVAADILSAALTGQSRVTPTAGAAVGITLVDGTSGDILWTNVAGAPGAVGSTDALKNALVSFRPRGVSATEQLTGKREAVNVAQSNSSDSTTKTNDATAQTEPAAKEDRHKAMNQEQAKSSI